MKNSLKYLRLTVLDLLSTMLTWTHCPEKHDNNVQSKTYTVTDESGTFNAIHIYWTQKRKFFIYELLKKTIFCREFFLFKRETANSMLIPNKNNQQTMYTAVCCIFTWTPAFFVDKSFWGIFSDGQNSRTCLQISLYSPNSALCSFQYFLDRQHISRLYPASKDSCRCSAVLVRYRVCPWLYISHVCIFLIQQPNLAPFILDLFENLDKRNKR